MNKKYLSVVLFGALLATSTGTFTSCKDYDDDIKGLQEQINKGGETVGALQEQLTKQLATLQDAVKAAQTAADAAKADAAKAQQAADAAKAVGDNAAEEAAKAKALAEEAKAAAADAKAEALAKIEAEVKLMKTYVDSSVASIREELGGKADKAELDAAVKELEESIELVMSSLSGRIDGIDASLNELKSQLGEANGKIEQNIKDIQGLIAGLAAVNEDLATQKEALKNLEAALTEKIEKGDAALKEELEAVKAEIALVDGKIAAAIQESEAKWKQELENLKDQSNRDLTGVKAALELMIQNLNDQMGEQKAFLLGEIAKQIQLSEASSQEERDRIEGRIDAIIEGLKNGDIATGGDISFLQGQINDINSRITTVTGQLEDRMDDIKDNIFTTLREEMTDIDEAIRTKITNEVASLHTLIAARLSSMTFVSDAISFGVGDAIKFTSLIYDAMPDNENAAIPNKYKFSTAALANARYAFNPASFKLSNATYSYFDNSAEVLSPAIGGMTRAAQSALVEIVGEPVKKDGFVNFQLLRINAHSTAPEIGKVNRIFLQAEMKGEALTKDETNAVITSATPAVVYDNLLDNEDVRIADKETLTADGDEAHYATTFDACKEEEPRYKTPYDKEFNLKELVATCFNNENVSTGHDEFPIEDYKLSYRFAVATTNYNITEGTTTNQQLWVKCNDPKEGLFQAVDFNKEAVGRTPILKVELVDEAGRVVRRGFVKIEFGVTKADDMNVGEAAKNLVVNCEDTRSTYELSTKFIRENVYRVITNGKETSMSHEEFWNMYDVSTAVTKITKNGRNYSMSSVPQIIAGPTDEGTATKMVRWEFTHGELGSIGANGSTFVASVTVKNKLVTSEYPEFVTFKFTVNVALPEFKLTKVENEIYWENDMFQVNVNVPQSEFESDATCLFIKDLNKAYKPYTVTGLPSCVSTRYKAVKAYSNGVVSSSALNGVRIERIGNEDLISLDKNNTAVKVALNSKNGLQVLVQHIYTLNSGDEIIVNEFMVNFIRPVNLNMPSGITLKDAVTDGDIADFQWNGLLTDWRGESIIKTGWELVDDITYSWNQVCTPEYKFTEGHYKEIQKAELDVQTGEMKFTTSGTLNMYTGTATYVYRALIIGRTTEKDYSVTTPMLSQAEVAAALDAMALEGQPPFYGAGVLKGEVSYETITIPAQTEVSYEYVKSVTYIPAVYEWEPGEPVLIPHTHTSEPIELGTSEGQVIGCWKWMALNNPRPVQIGQYWDYYGAFGDVSLNVNGATTNLTYNGGKLPDGATLVQTNNTVKYVNVDSPIKYTYQIFIPATVSYGWGTATATLTLTVNPVNTNN